jgi:hypothetical protein
MPSPGVSQNSGSSPGTGEGRRIVGVLITYSWRPDGQLFEIREGKNFIGAGEVSSDATHRKCDILITDDPKMSAEHALILCRHGRYDLVDQKSSNGTFMNEALVPLEGITLENYAKVRTGATNWTFIKIEPPEGPARPGRETAPKPEPEEPSQPERGDRPSKVW